MLRCELDVMEYVVTLEDEEFEDFEFFEEGDE